MNLYFKADCDYWGDKETVGGVVVGENEAECFDKCLERFGRDNVCQITFWYSENWEDDVIETVDFNDCPLFDTKSNS